MSVWVCVPSKRPPAEVEKWAQAWTRQGYHIAVWIDVQTRDEHQRYSDWLWNIVSKEGAQPHNTLVISDQGYPGYAKATNALIRDRLEVPNARWFVIGGDDVFPDTTKRADEIAQECEQYFVGLHAGRDLVQHGKYRARDEAERLGTFGVMQPTGDRWGDSEQSRDQYGENRGAYIDRIAGSAWIGREFALRINGGNGPLWPEYFHMFPDEELQCVAEKLGVFWQRPDLTQIHQHWARGDNRTRAEHMPAFLTEANSPEHWDTYKRLFESRKAAGFPGHEVRV